MGAWIETCAYVARYCTKKLLPLWEHGLKPRPKIRSFKTTAVAPFMGAWIETDDWIIGKEYEGLLPLWEHGLKLTKANARSIGYCCSLYGSMD